MNEQGRVSNMQRLMEWFSSLWQRAPVPSVRTPLRQARVLIDTTRAIADMPDVVQLMTTLLDQLDKVVPATNATIHLIEGDNQRLVAARQFSGTLPEIGSCWPRSWFALTERIAETRAPVLVPDVRNDLRWRHIEGIDYVRSWLGVPLLAHDELLGFLMLDRAEPIGFRPGEVDMALLFASQLALGLRMANLAASRQGQLADLSALYALSRTASASLKLDELLPALAEHLQSLVGVTSCSIMLRDDDGQIQPAAAAGQFHEQFRQIRLSPNEPSLGREAMDRRSPVLVTDSTSFHLVNPRLMEIIEAKSLLAIPLLVHAEAIGAVIFGDNQQPHRFSDMVIKHAQVAVGHAALAITNSRLFEASERHARELALRDRVRMAIAAAPPDLEALAHQVSLSLAEVFGYAHVNCWRAQDDHLVLVSTIDADNDEPGITLPLDSGICGGVARSGQPRLVADVKSCAEYISYDKAHGRHETTTESLAVVSEMCVPVINGEQVVLVINVEHTARLGKGDLHMLTEIAAQVGLALEQVQLVKEVQRVQADLARSARMAAVGTLAAGVAHEFNNMLAAMVGYAQLALVGTSEEQVEALELVLSMARRGKQITGSLLTFAAAESRRRMLVALDELVDQGLDLVAPELTQMGVEVRRQRCAQALVSVDAAQMVQVVVHLLTNARDALSGGGVLTVSTGVRETAAELLVHDTGIGIPVTVRERLFEPFVTTKGALGGGNQGGVGLGLSVCYSIVRGHGGSIEAESSLGAGSTFRVLLPLHRTADLEPLDSTLPVAQRALRVLVVDDDSLIQALLRATLQRVGHTVLLASDAESAHTFVQQGGIDVILCDLSLPGANGIELAEQLHAAGSHLPFILMTGRVDVAGLTRVREAPIARLLTKPFQTDEVLAALAAAAP